MQRAASIPLSLKLPPEDDARLLEQIQRLANDDIIGQLLNRNGRMAELATEGDDIKLDWVDGDEIALQHPEWIRQCEEEAFEILQQGIRHIIWSGMGGSVQTVYVLKRMGLLDTPNLHIYPCDSTDPASLNRILREINQNEKEAGGSFKDIAALLKHTMMIGVSMGMTSEEPITHLTWFDGILSDAGIEDRGAHIQVMTLPDSYLDQFAGPRGCKMVPIQLDGGNHTPGRMSAPATRVFIRPVALRLVADALRENAAYRPDGSRLSGILEQIQEYYGVSHSLDSSARAAFVNDNPFIRLGALIDVRTNNGNNHVALLTAQEWNGFSPWLEQLIEESLGKGGKGFLLFYDDQKWDSIATELLRLSFDDERSAEAVLQLPAASDDHDRIALIGGLFAGFKLTVATFGYLQAITFAGQPAVEAYKAYARKFRDAGGEVPFPAAQCAHGCIGLHTDSVPGASRTIPQFERVSGKPVQAADVLLSILEPAAESLARKFRYLDITFNGEITDPLRDALCCARKSLANDALRIPCKIRTGPSDYHSTEQSQVDGPAELVSIRIVAMKHVTPAVGDYSDKFLLAQARGTWQAMEDAGRSIVMLTMPNLNDESLTDLSQLFDTVTNLLLDAESE